MKRAHPTPDERADTLPLFRLYPHMYSVNETIYSHHRDTYLEQQQTEKIETEVRGVDRIRITKVYACCPGWPSGGHKSATVRHKHMLFPPDRISPLITEDLPGRVAAGVTFDNWFSSFGQLSGTGRPLKLLAPSVLVLQPATSQARLHGVPGQTSLYICQ